MRLVLIVAFTLVSAAFGQRTLNPIGTNGNVLHPGVPLTGSPASSVAARNGLVPPGRAGGGRLGGRASRSNGATLIVPYPVYGGGCYDPGFGFDGFYHGGYPNVHNPPPGTYDPIFGGYNPGPQGGWNTPQGGQNSPTVILPRKAITATA